jgi:hypothetical protein
MAPPAIITIRQHIAWSYANLAMADAALSESAEKYGRVHFMIRNRLYHGLISGRMGMRTLYDDERLKMTMPQACYYCGSAEKLTADHLIPRIKGGRDEADNLIWACRRCNSSKHGRDMLEWKAMKGDFPAVLVLRRYLKIVARHCDAEGCMDPQLSRAGDLGLPFEVALLPTVFPPLVELRRWVYAAEG